MNPVDAGRLLFARRTPFWAEGGGDSWHSYCSIDEAPDYVRHPPRLGCEDAHIRKPVVTNAIYSVTRNPMYVGLTRLLTMWAVHLAVPLALLGPITFALFIPEEVSGCPSRPEYRLVHDLT